MDFYLFFNINDFLYKIAIILARISPTFFMITFLKTNIVTGTIRYSVLALFSITLCSLDIKIPFHSENISIFFVILHEILIGIIIGCILSWPFWVVHALGCIIDNQRGATLSSTIDPANGIDTTEIANFLNLFTTVIYLQGGGLVLIIKTFYQSYFLCSPIENCESSLPSLLNFINKITTESLILSSPIILILLMSEITLGLLSRFASQMNAFSISLAIKSIISILMLIIISLSNITDKTLNHSLQDIKIWIKKKEDLLVIQ